MMILRKFFLFELTAALSFVAFAQPARNTTVRSVADLPATTQLGAWRNLGPFNFAGKVYDLAVDPRNAAVVYAAYGSGGEIGTTNGGGLWRTRDGGRTWAPAVERARDLGFLCVKTHATVAGYVAAGLRAVGYNQDRGVLLSRDGGETWKNIGPPDRNFSVIDLALDPKDPSTLYAATQNFLLKTTDGGASWKPVLSYAGAGFDFWPDAPSIAMHPTDGRTLLFSVRSLGVMRTADGGANWTRVDRAWDQSDPMTMAAFAPSDGNIVYAERVQPQRDEKNVATRQVATYRSADGGRTWTQMPTIEAYHQGRYDMSLAVDPKDPNHVIVANTTMWTSTDGLRTLTQPLAPPHSDFLRTVFAPSDARIVYNGNDGGVFKSLDGGLTWARADLGVTATHLFSFAVAADGGRIYLSPGDYSSILFEPRYGWRFAGRGQDGTSCGEEFEQFYANPHDAGDFYVGGKLRRVGQGFWSCSSIDPAPDESRNGRLAMAFDPVDANTVYVGLEHLWKSADRGAHWTKISIDDAIAKQHRHITVLAVAQGDAKTIYALISGRDVLWVSHDGGGKWSSTYPVAGVSALAVSPKDAGTVYMGGGFGLYVSHDGGESGRMLENFPPFAGVQKIAIDPAQPERMFVGTGNGVLVSADAGASWSRLGKDMPLGAVADLALVKGTLYASSNQGLWSMDLSGRAACEQPALVTPSVPVMLGSAGGVMRFDIGAVQGCPWKAAADAGWARLETGPAWVEVRVERNSGTTRNATLSVAGQKIPLTQFGGPDPIADGATVTIANGGNCLTTAGETRTTLSACSGAPTQRFVLQHNRDLLYRVMSLANGECLDTTRRRQVGVALAHYPCHGEDQQLFQLMPQAGGGYRLFGNFALQCLEAGGEGVRQQACKESEAQRFLVK